MWHIWKQHHVIECFWKIMKSIFHMRSMQLQGDGLYTALLIKVFRLCIGAPFASPRRFFQIDDHPDHAQIEARGGFARLPCDAFSYPFFNNLRNLGTFWQFGIIS